MPVFVDQLNREIILDQKPSRIISLVPSQTELLYDLGLNERVVGITKFCAHPQEWLKTKAIVGGTKNLNFNKIASLNPDLIIGNKEENEKEQIEKLMLNYNVWMSDVENLTHCFDMITRLGTLLGEEKKANELKITAEYNFNQLLSEIEQLQITSKTVAYLIWNNPYMAVGRNNFINAMLEKCQLINVFNETNFSRYPEVTAELIQLKAPQVILLSSEPYPFKEQHVKDMKQICPSAKILLVDGEMFSWYGSRIKNAPAYYKNIIKQLI